MQTQTQQTNNTHSVTVNTTAHTHVKHSKRAVAIQVLAQNKANAHLYTTAQHNESIALQKALQLMFTNKKVYINARDTHLSVSLANTTTICKNVMLVAKYYNILSIKQTNTALVFIVAVV